MEKTDLIRSTVVRASEYESSRSRCFLHPQEQIAYCDSNNRNSNVRRELAEPRESLGGRKNRNHSDQDQRAYFDVRYVRIDHTATSRAAELRPNFQERNSTFAMRTRRQRADFRFHRELRCDDVGNLGHRPARIRIAHFLQGEATTLRDADGPRHSNPRALRPNSTDQGNDEPALAPWSL